MYKIKKVEFGFFMTLGGEVGVEEASAWLKEYTAELDEINEPFGVFVDMRTLLPLSEEAMVPLNEGQRLSREKGLTRSVVILEDNLTILQLIKIAKRTGIDKTERYISAIDNEDWEQQGLDWIIEGKEPAG